jgi:hypothetical protein
MRSAPHRRFSSEDQIDRLGRDARGRDLGRPRSRSPKESETLPVPAEDRVRLHDEKRISPPRDQTRENHEKAPLVPGEPRLLDGPCGDEELLAQERVLGEEFLP